MSGHMDPERLAEMRKSAKRGVPAHSALTTLLLAHADHWEAEADFWQRSVKGSRELREDMELRMMRAEAEAKDARAEAKRYRARCPVTAGDVESAGVTREHAEQWLHRLGFHPYECMGHSTLWRDIETEQHACTTSDRPGDLAAAIGLLANASAEQCAFDILDEMAAMDTGAEVDQ